MASRTKLTIRGRSVNSTASAPSKWLTNPGRPSPQPSSSTAPPRCILRRHRPPSVDMGESSICDRYRAESQNRVPLQVPSAQMDGRGEAWSSTVFKPSSGAFTLAPGAFTPVSRAFIPAPGVFTHSPATLPSAPVIQHSPTAGASPSPSSPASPHPICPHQSCGVARWAKKAGNRISRHPLTLPAGFPAPSAVSGAGARGGRLSELMRTTAQSRAASVPRASGSMMPWGRR
eukprot:scaffold27518_cov112-Isochrysis_galbana.AAC.1